MQVVSTRKLEDFCRRHSDCRPSLLAWYRLMAASSFPDPPALRAAFPQVDYVKPFYVFNIGRAYRLVVVMQFPTRRAFIRHVMTHAEYDRGQWKAK